ncbi:uncharacterized protein LOC110686889 [Chenopodium quinoa]|uniref:uncharacterized protein LOC110686889 n=1 Tax=Chenopodium quinoa TaxID=63459 RepID=UPI000B776E3D|nr:uncharacterized protein LOC110686889 [Chenopodium quinoa]
MSLALVFISAYRQLATLRPTLYYAGIWTTMLILTVVVASFSPELAFMEAITRYSPSCGGDGYVRIPLDMPGERVCLPAHMLKRSTLDVFIPTLFSALIVASSALLLRSLGLS